MDERGYIRSIHRHLPVEEVYRWKINDRLAKGVADSYYSGNGGDLWAEYKYLKSTPKRQFTAALTPLQLRWLCQRAEEGRHVRVIVGCPAGSQILTPHQCKEPIRTIENWISAKEVAQWILTTTSRS